MQSSTLVQQQKGISNTHAAGAFMTLIFISVTVGLVVLALRDTLGINVDDIWFNCASTAVKYVLYFMVFMFFCARADSHGPALYRDIKLSRHLDYNNVIISVLLAGICIAGFLLLTEAAGRLFITMGYIPAPDLMVNSFPEYIGVVLVLAVMPAVIEELLFRGLIFKGMLSFGRVKAVVASAVLFSLFHMSPAQTVYQFILGLVLAAVVLKTGNLVYGMIMHFANNFLIITYTYVTGAPAVAAAFDTGTIVLTVMLAIFATLFVVGLLRALKRHTHHEHGTKRFLSIDNFGYLICVALAGSIWILNFVG
jgi:membrane protease YdiL (CAAX protease family)